MKRCNCCNKEYETLRSLVEQGRVVGTLKGRQYVGYCSETKESIYEGYDLILVNCSCNSTLAIKSDDLTDELFNTKVG